MLSGGDGRFPEQFQVVEEAKGEEELSEVGAWWHGLGVAEIVSKVVGKVVTSTDVVGHVGNRYILVESK